MDTLRLTTRNTRLDINELGMQPHSVVDIMINGRNLIEILREMELPFAQAEGHVESAGNYEGLPPEWVFLPSKHLFGEPNEDYHDDDYPPGKSAIFGCGTCGVLSCWPFLVRITVGDEVVVWSDFENWHRGSAEWAASHWRHDSLQFTFDRTQYEAELAKPPPGRSAG